MNQCDLPTGCVLICVTAHCVRKTQRFINVSWYFISELLHLYTGKNSKKRIPKANLDLTRVYLTCKEEVGCLVNLSSVREWDHQPARPAGQSAEPACAGLQVQLSDRHPHRGLQPHLPDYTLPDVQQNPGGGGQAGEPHKPKYTREPDHSTQSYI